MRNFITPLINCKELVANSLHNDLTRLFHFHLSYAHASYFLDRKISLSRQRYSTKQFVFEFYQGIVQKPTFITLKLKCEQPMLVISLLGNIGLKNQDKVLQRLHQGECLLIRWPAATYQIIADHRKTKLLLISIDQHWLKSTFQGHSNLTPIFTHKAGHYTQLIACAMRFSQWRILIRMLTAEFSQGIPLNIFLSKIVEQLLILYEEALREKQSSDLKRINKVTDYILSSIHQYQKIPDVEQLAIKFGFTRRSLEKTCREVTGLAPIQFINNLRLAEGRLMLADTDKSVKEIADLLLYNSHSHFTSAFHKQFGIKPTAFREMQRNGLSNLGSTNRFQNRAKI